ncbi:MAG: hypothetical protein LBL13_14065 [Bacteroidales bacterium]|nr:hypothetical protein [Bacteroidales bacterium]
MKIVYISCASMLHDVNKTAMSVVIIRFKNLFHFLPVFIYVILYVVNVTPPLATDRNPPSENRDKNMSVWSKNVLTELIEKHTRDFFLSSV